MDCNEVIINQINEERRLTELDNQFYDLTQKYKSLINQIPYNDILKMNSEEVSNDKDINFLKIKELHSNNREKFNDIVSEFNKYPEYKESARILDLRNEVKYKFFTQFFKYISLLNADRNSLFSKEYKDKINFLADNGYFLFHYQFPDENICLLEDYLLEDYLIKIYSQNEGQLIKYIFNEVFSLKTFDSRLQDYKINDLKEAIDCFINKSYNSCARTMFSLLENEHYKVSEFEGITSGKERSNKITSFVNRLNIDYYKNMWSRMNEFYKQCNLSMKNQEDKLNRNDLMHGGYVHKVTCGDCLKLILLYINMKNIRYILNNFNLFLEELSNDIKLYKIIEK